MDSSFTLFFRNLMNALKVVIDSLTFISWDISNVSVCLMDVVVYGGVVATVMTAIKGMHMSGLIEIKKKERDKFNAS